MVLRADEFKAYIHLRELSNQPEVAVIQPSGWPPPHAHFESRITITITFGVLIEQTSGWAAVAQRAKRPRTNGVGAGRWRGNAFKEVSSTATEQGA